MKEYIDSPTAMIVRQPESEPAFRLPTGTIAERKLLEMGPYKDCLADPNGLTLSREDFPELYRVIGDLYKRGDEPPGEFRIPDLRSFAVALHDCNVDLDLKQIEHPANRHDWEAPGSSQGYQVYRCKVCGDYWGIRYQWDAGTGHDDRAQRFGPDITMVKRHY